MRLPAACFLVARWGILLLAVMMLIGHICVLPTHAHVETAPWHGDQAQPHDADEAVHAASCEALPSAGIACPTVLTVSTFVAAVPVEPLKRLADRGGLSPLPTPSPPLFLLHAALLI
jgi:hypothetical protein